MQNEVIFFILKFSKADWTSIYEIDAEKIDSFLNWLWDQVNEEISLEPKEWINSMISKFKSNQ